MCCFKLPNDAHLLRFLRACDFDTVKAREMVMNSIIWRKQHNVDKILSTYEEPTIFREYFPGTWNHFDKEGRPLYVLRFGLIDIKGLFKAVGEESIVKFVLSLCEQGLKKTSEATATFGKPISTWTLLVDLEGLSLRHLWRPGIRTLLNIIEVVEANYPETMGLVLIVRAPWAFPVLWSVVSSFINEKTAQKFMIYGGNDYVEGLRSYIDEKRIPHFLQGDCCLKIPDGGIVPKSSYRSDIIEHNTESILASLYHTGYAYKALPLEASFNLHNQVLIPVNEIDCVITWDFDVVKSTCLFNVYFTPRIVQPESVQNPPSALSTLSPSGFMATSGIGGNRPALFDRNAELGIDLFLEEKCQSCEEGSSVQGSHICQRTGTYVLQWRLPDSLHGAQLPFDFSIPLTHRCKVMYYYEVLDSCNYKGSLASIASSLSSFNSLSARTASQKSLNVIQDGSPVNVEVGS
ncbi:unnamed protein product [Soboliphyme baturini]|uniref:CRAL-TRIO domain-containing protein n=1 Tax=Soboliphyme baturini TaxID=241478 RepID=A0A183IZB2_9BILA|nr:unnamed protein product [Soboliphyme baturini]